MVVARGSAARTKNCNESKRYRGFSASQIPAGAKNEVQLQIESHLIRRLDPYGVHRRGREGVSVPTDSEAGSSSRPGGSACHWQFNVGLQPHFSTMHS